MTEHLKTLIQILSDGQFHSGAELGQALGLTRSAIWKLIQQFPEWDIEVEARTNKGYRIPQGLELLDKTKILQDCQIEIFDSLPSTNNYLMEIAATGTDIVQVCLAEKQTAGKGRLGRTWVSPYARNIYLSVLWPFSKDLSQLSGLSLIIALAILNALKEYGITKGLGLKWPNDVLYQEKKLAGVLIELHGETHSHCCAVIGVGLNVDMPESFLQHIDRPVIDVATIVQTKPQRNQLVNLLLNQMFKMLHLFQTEGLTPFLSEWQAVDLTMNKPVEIITAQGNISGVGKGIDKAGRFILENEEGEKQYFSSGEVSLRLGVV